MKVAWMCYYERSLNVENTWGEEEIPCADPTEGPAIQIDSGVVR